MPTLPSLRFPGDGFDFRRPASRPPNQDIIDLTDDNIPAEALGQPQPSARPHQIRRVTRDPIDVDDESTRATVDSASLSPDLELLEVRSIRSRAASDAEPRRRQDLRQSRPRPDVRPPGPSHTENYPSTVGDWGAMRSRTAGRERGRHLVQQTARHFHQLLHSNNRTPPADFLLTHEGQNIILPGDLDFVTQGFRMGDVASVRPAQPALPTYDAPSAPRSGYTRSPKEGDVLVCPNCEEELGTGQDDCKRQVWVIKACGHVRQLFPVGFEYGLIQARSIAANAPRIDHLARRARLLASPRPSPLQDALLRVVPTPSPFLQLKRFFKYISDVHIN
ncbi:MAG: hypothetical protein Q9222_002672 [Ikaeria aurantiellina]